MKNKLSNLLVEITAALIMTTLWFPILWAVDYPVEEWIGVVVIGYVSFTAARLIVVNLTVVLATRLGNRARRLAEQLDIDMDSYTNKRSVSILVNVFLVMSTTILGLTLTMMTPVLSVTGLSPLGLTFNVIAWTLLGIGLALQVLFFAGFYLLFRLTEDIIKQPEEWLKSHQNVTKMLGILHRISRRDAYSVLPRPWLSALKLPLS